MNIRALDRRSCFCYNGYGGSAAHLTSRIRPLNQQHPCNHLHLWDWDHSINAHNRYLYMNLADFVWDTPTYLT